MILVAAYSLWHLGSLFDHDTQNSQRRRFKNSLFFCDSSPNKSPSTGPRPIWRTDTLSPFFGREKNTDGGVVWLRKNLLWRLSSRKTFFAPALGLPTEMGLGRSWLFPASSILPIRNPKSWWVIFSPT